MFQVFIAPVTDLPEFPTKSGIGAQSWIHVMRLTVM